MNNFKKAHEARGCTSKWLADQTGISYRTIQFYDQNGCDKAGLDTIVRLSKALDTKIEDLITDSELRDQFKNAI